MARSERWTEEVALLWEEMDRAVQYCFWLSGWWKEQATRRLDNSPALREGLIAYATKQAAAEHALGTAWAVKFQSARQLAEEFLAGTHLKDILKLRDSAVSSGPQIPVSNREPVAVAEPLQAADRRPEPEPERRPEVADDLIEISLEDPAEPYLFDDEADDF